jgi:hypothetical protein
LTPDDRALIAVVEQYLAAVAKSKAAGRISSQFMDDDPQGDAPRQSLERAKDIEAELEALVIAGPAYTPEGWRAKARAVMAWIGIDGPRVSGGHGPIALSLVKDLLRGCSPTLIAACARFIEEERDPSEAIDPPRRSARFVSWDGFVRDGVWTLAIIELGTKHFEIVPTEFTDISQLRAAPGRVDFIGGSPSEPPALIDLDLSSGRSRVVRRASVLRDDVRRYVSLPQPIAFPTGGGETALSRCFELAGGPAAG